VSAVIFPPFSMRSPRAPTTVVPVISRVSTPGRGDNLSSPPVVTTRERSTVYVPVDRMWRVVILHSPLPGEPVVTSHGSTAADPAVNKARPNIRTVITIPLPRVPLMSSLPPRPPLVATRTRDIRRWPDANARQCAPYFARDPRRAAVVQASFPVSRL